MKVVFFGAGHISHAHQQAVARLGVEVVGVCTRGESGKEFAQKYQCRYFDSGRRMMESCNPDAVFLLTHPAAYFDILSSIRSFNKPVVLEKPLPMPSIEAEKLRSVLPEHTFVGLNRRFYSNVQALLPILEEEPRFSAQLTLSERMKDYQNLAKEDRDNFHLYNDIHYIDLLFFLAGMPTKIHAKTTWGELAATRLPQYSVVTAETDRQNVMTMLSNFDSPGGCRINIFLSKREIIISPIEKTVIKSLSGVEELPLSEDDTAVKQGFVAQARCFFEGITSNALPENWVSFEVALRSMHAIEKLF